MTNPKTGKAKQTRTRGIGKYRIPNALRAQWWYKLCFYRLLMVENANG